MRRLDTKFRRAYTCRPTARARIADGIGRCSQLIDSFGGIIPALRRIVAGATCVLLPGPAFADSAIDLAVKPYFVLGGSVGALLFLGIGALLGRRHRCGALPSARARTCRAGDRPGGRRPLPARGQPVRRGRGRGRRVRDLERHIAGEVSLPGGAEVDALRSPRAQRWRLPLPLPFEAAAMRSRRPVEMEAKVRLTSIFACAIRSRHQRQISDDVIQS